MTNLFKHTLLPSQKAICSFFTVLLLSIFTFLASAQDCVSNPAQAGDMAEMLNHTRSLHLFVRINSKGIEGSLIFYLCNAQDASKIRPGDFPFGFTLNSNKLKLVIQNTKSGEAGSIGYCFNSDFPEELFRSNNRLIMSGFDLFNTTSLMVSILIENDAQLLFIRPEAKFLNSNNVNNGERVQIELQNYKDKFIDIGLHKIELVSKDSPISLDNLFSTAIKFGTSLITAIVILFFSTITRRWMSIKAVQLGELQTLKTMIQRIDEGDDDKSLRNELMNYLKEMQTKPEYSGFALVFTNQIESMIKLGITDNVNKYWELYNKIKTGVNMQWVFFVP